ncbi:hypothetical protein AMJ86_03385 [bacterium SM23_57]|nr:MAG: hypothetical protein AMJ86_03385 [bacterium SM23_57]
MTLNPTLNYLLEKFSISVIPFSKTVSDSSTYLAGAGGCVGDGFPLPAGGEILGIRAYDGNKTEEKSGSVVINANDRISVFAEYVESWFDLTVQVNGEPTSISVQEMAENADLFVCVLIKLQQS